MSNEQGTMIKRTLDKPIIPRPEIAEVLHELRFTRYCNSRSLPNPEKGHCKWCGKKVPHKTRVWCSGECRKEAYVRFGYVSGYLFKRDKGICAKCNIDCDWLGTELKKIKQTFYRYRYRYRGIPNLYYNYCRDWGPWWTENYRYWEAAHIIPVCEGGGCCGLENYQTLCLRCHKEDSKKLAGSRANR